MGLVDIDFGCERDLASGHMAFIPGLRHSTMATAGNQWLSSNVLNGVTTSIKRHLRSLGKEYQYTASHESTRGGLEELEASTPEPENGLYVYSTRLMGIYVQALPATDALARRT